MRRMTRFGVSLEQGLLQRFDAYVKEARHRNRSAALREIIRNYLVSREWTAGTRDVAALIGLVIHNDSPGVLRRLQSLARAHRHYLLSSSSYHLHDDYTLVVAVLFGPAQLLQSVAQEFLSCRGVVHGNVIPLVPAPPCSHISTQASTNT